MVQTTPLPNFWASAGCRIGEHDWFVVSQRRAGYRTARLPHKKGASHISLHLHPGLAALGIGFPVLLAPMAGITDLPFRRIARRFGVGLATSEMVASEEIVRAKPSARARAEIEGGPGASVQLAGRDPHWMGEAAKLLRDRGATVIDINMGCPAKKVTGGQSGSALMRDPDLALRIIEAVAASGVPTTVKMRLGWCDDSLTAPSLAQRAEAAGAAMITVHGRTRMQFYRGAADWSAVGATVRAVSIPVVVNGDVVDAESAREALRRSGAAAVMVGRGAQGAPWLPSRIAANLAGAPAEPVPCGGRLAAEVLAHHDHALRFYGADLGGRVMRKHLGWYLAAAGVQADIRRAVVTASEPGEVRRLVLDALDRPREAAA